MVDKIWYDWQHTNPANFWSFGGGATAVVTNFVPDPAFVNGAPPFLKVHSLLTNTCSIDEPRGSSLRQSRRMV